MKSERGLFYIIAIAIVGRAKRATTKRSKELIPEMKQRRLRAIILQGPIRKSSILINLSLYLKVIKSKLLMVNFV